MKCKIIIFRWQVSDWSSCSKSCGGGLWSRNVTCAQEKDLELDSDQKCDNKTKPVTLQACNNHPCYNHWHSGHWSPVSSQLTITIHGIISFVNFSALLVVVMGLKEGT